MTTSEERKGKGKKRRRSKIYYINSLPSEVRGKKKEEKLGGGLEVRERERKKIG